jgi:hypothetical protein
MRRNPRSFKVKLVCQRLVGRKWKAAGSYTARLDASGGSYSSQISLPRTGCWRVRAVHGSGKRAVYSGYAYVRVVARTR